MAFNNLITSLLVMSCLIGIVSMAEARDLPIHKPGEHLAARLEQAGMVDCWNALLELRSCTNEIILFFMDGEAYLGLECCKAIRLITHQCWPSMLTNLGFTAEEGDILQGYCDTSSPSPTQSVAPFPSFSVPPPTSLVDVDVVG